MGILLISYDLSRAKSEDYKVLHDAIKAVAGEANAHWMNESVWLIDTFETPIVVHAELINAKALEKEELVLITPIEKGKIAYRAKNGTNSWIEKHS